MSVASGIGTSTQPRTPLSRERVLLEAVALADEHGIGTLTMRRLADRLLVEPRSLYHHVANKDEILDGMVDVVFREIELPSMHAEWKTAMRERATSARAALRRHPWAIGRMESRATPGPATLRHHDAVVGCLRYAGFTDRADGPRLLGHRQLPLRLRDAGAQPALHHRRGDRPRWPWPSSISSRPRSTHTSPN